MAARVKFNSEDDHHLVQYLAEHAPVGGRGGNVLYKNLCNNEGNLWPWSKRHPWQSWRDHYCKDSGRFDAKIKSYLKRTHPASSNLTGVEKSQVRTVAKAPAPGPRAVETKKVALAQTAPAKASATIVKTKKPSVTARKSANEPKPTEEGYDGEVPDSQSVVEEEDVKWDRSYENELFGSYASGESDEEVDEDAELAPEQHDSPASSRAPSPDADENIYPNIEDVPNPEHELDPHPPGAFNTIPPNSGLRTPPSAKQGLTQPPKKLKRKIRDAEEDPFGDSSPPPASPVKKPAMPATNRRNPPVRVDGGFRTTLKTVTNSQNVSNWPPVRGAPQTQRKAEDVVMVEAEPEAVILVPATQSQPKAAVRRPAQPQVNAAASSSKLKAPSERRPTQQPPQKRQRVENEPPPVRRPIVEPRPKPAPPPPQQPPAPSVHLAQPARHAPPPPRPAQPAQHAADVFSSRHHRQSTTHTDDAPRIDLRRSIHKGRVSSRRDSSLHSYSRRHSSISNSSAALDPTSARMMEHLNGEIEKLGPKFGFSFEVVRQTYLATASLDNTKVVLTFLLEWMRKGQEEIERRHPELFVHSYEHGPGAGSDGEAPEGLVPESHLQRQVLETRTREQNKLLEQSAKGSAKRPRASLNYKLLPPDVQDEVEWSPPNKTRAGEYARLTREGREDEAREREQRRLSGPYNKARDRELPRHRERTLEEQQIPPEKLYAPSLLQERQDTDETMALDEAKEEKFDPRNIDDIYASQEAETQEPLNQQAQQAQPEEERILEPTSAQPPPHQRQHAAASAPEERSHISISDDEDNTGRARDADPEAVPDVDPDPDRLHVLYEEHKRLTEQVRFDDDLSMKAFTALEKRLREEPDKLLLRRWSAARVQERVEAASRAQEWRLEEYTRKQEEERVKLEEMDRKRKKGA